MICPNQHADVTSLPPLPRCDAIVISPLPSPSETNPPLGPYLLRQCARRSDLAVEVVDLNILHLGRFAGSASSSHRSTVGDHDKDRRRTHAARDDFRGLVELRHGDTLHVPCCADPLLGMHLTRDAVTRLVEEACTAGHPLRRLVEVDLLDRITCAPAVFGLSIMGPAQVIPALAVAQLLKRRWPDTPIVAGGSHVTLLHDTLVDGLLSTTPVDLALAGHCENQFTRLVQSLGTPLADSRTVIESCRKAPVNATPLVQVTPLPSPQPPFEYEPAIEPSDLVHYPDAVTIPMQLTRGCTMACTYCTYPAVERDRPAPIDFASALGAIRTLIASTGVRRFSFKDSLFTLEHLRSFAKHLIDSTLSIEWSATTYLRRGLTREALDLLHKSGCRTLEFGLETIDPVGQSFFRKKIPLDMAEAVIREAAAAGITVIVNQIFGWPGQSRQSADRQLLWYRDLRASCPERIRASANMLEVNRSAPLADSTAIRRWGIAPWAFSFAWDAPSWRPELHEEIRSLE